MGPSAMSAPRQRKPPTKPARGVIYPVLRVEGPSIPDFVVEGGLITFSEDTITVGTTMVCVMVVWSLMDP